MHVPVALRRKPGWLAAHGCMEDERNPNGLKARQWHFWSSANARLGRAPAPACRQGPGCFLGFISHLPPAPGARPVPGPKSPRGWGGGGGGDGRPGHDGALGPCSVPGRVNLSNFGGSICRPARSGSAFYTEFLKIAIKSKNLYHSDIQL